MRTYIYHLIIFIKNNLKTYKRACMNLIVSAPQTSLLSTTETETVTTLALYKGGKVILSHTRRSQFLHTLP
jgi:hypothetical protein